MYRYISVYSYRHIYTYIVIPIVTHADIQLSKKNSYTDSCMYGYMTDRNEGYQSAITEPICEKHPQNPLFCPLRYNPTFLFRIVQVVFLYVQRSYLGRTHKNQLAPKQPGSGGAGLLRGRKKVATPFFSCKAHHSRRRATKHPQTIKTITMLRHGSLFSGIGGFDIAASWMGWQNVFSCEKDPFCRTFLKHYWPNTTHYEDIYNFQATHFRGHIDIISGGFPCQPFSQAGRRKGAKDDRYLFPETIRIIKEARPEWIVLENVTGLFTILQPDSLSEMEIKAIELFCQDGEQPAISTIIRLQRRVIGNIISEIGPAGYVLPKLEDGTPVILCMPAAAVGAPHQRDRVWCVAHADGDRNKQYKNNDGTGTGQTTAKGQEERAGQRRPSILDGFFDLSCPDLPMEPVRGNSPEDAQRNTEAFAESAADSGADRWHDIPLWTGWPSEPPFCGRDDGLSERLGGITFPAWQAESIKAYGNAIVPQVALEIFRAIQSVTLNHRAP